MNVLSLCRQWCPDKLPVQPGDRLGDGADGETFTIVDDPSKVIKLGVIYDSPVCSVSYYATIQQALDYVMHAQPPVYVRVYQHGYLGQYHRQKFVPPRKRMKQEFVLYYYVMERLQKLTEDEQKVFHSILSHEDRGIRKNYPIHQIEEMLHGMSRGLDFDVKRVIFFCQNLRRQPILHLDVSVRNIMRDASGNFKLIDLDRIQMENITCKK